MERKIIKDFPQIQFNPGKFNMWSPSNDTVFYDTRRIKSNNGLLGLLHELGHALLDHRRYKYDIELINMEMDAWDEARRLAPKYGLKIDEAHIARCISSYDYWLSKRATCPDCANFSLQNGRHQYKCFACGMSWKVNQRLDRRVKRDTIERFETVTFVHPHAENSAAL